MPPPGFDAQPPGFDSQPPPPPPIDASRPEVAPPNDCPDADSTLIYLLDANQRLFSFYPPTLDFTNIATLACPGGDMPYSMAVDRKGKAFSVFYPGGALMEISTATAACTTAKYQPGQHGFTVFGMGFSGNATSETLYVAQADPNFMATSGGLGSIDTTTFGLSFIGTFSQPLNRCELTGTGDGRLFAFCVDSNTGSTIAQIDPATAQVIGENHLQVGTSSDAFAFAYWGGSFWIFTGSGNSTITQYDLDTQKESTVTTVPALIVGAGVSTCAPR
jgi:hypothetical protein